MPIAFFHQNEVSGVQGGIERYIATLINESQDSAYLVTEAQEHTVPNRIFVPMPKIGALPRWLRYVIGVWKDKNKIQQYMNEHSIRAFEFSRPEYVLFAFLFSGKKTFTIHGTGPKWQEFTKFALHYVSSLFLPLVADAIQVVGRDSSGLPYCVRKIMHRKIRFIDAWYDDCFVPTPFPDLSTCLKIFYAGRLDSMKNPDLLFSIIEAIKSEKNTAVEFYYFGSDGHRIPERLRNTAIKDCGLMSAPALAQAIADCHMGILCSGYGEGSPFIVVETLACGRAYILPPLPGLQSAYSAHDGIEFATEYSVAAYRHKIEKMLEKLRAGTVSYTDIARSVSTRSRSVSARAILDQLL